MNRSFWLILVICVGSLLAACGGGSYSKGGGGGSQQSATHLSITAPATAISGTASNVTVTAVDASNNVVTTYTGTVRFSSIDGQAVLPANSTLTNGTATFSFTLKTIGSQTITATDTVAATITGTSGPITVNAAATHFSVTAPSAATAGTPFKFTVTPLDASNKVVANYSGTVRFLSSDNQAVLPADAQFTNGAQTFSVILETAGSETITAIDITTSSITGTSNSIAVSGAAGGATHFSVTVPAAAITGVVFNITVTALDPSNNVAASYSGSVQFTSTDSQGALPANSALVNGTGTFSVTFKTVGNQTLTATDTAAMVITGTSNPITVTGPINHFSVTAPAAATAGISFNITVNALDASNNLVTFYTSKVLVTSTDGQAVLPVNPMLQDGSAILSTTLKTIGTQTISVTDRVRHSISGTSNSINVNSNTATHFSVTAPASVGANKPFTLTVTALDSANNTAVGYSGTVHFMSSDADAALPADSTLTNGSGTFTVTLKTTGSQTITATDTVTASITGISNSIGVFTRCSTQGSQCGPSILPPCCNGLVCAPATTRAYCEPGGSAKPGEIRPSSEGSERASRFAATCNLEAARESHTATLLDNGLVLITGGSEKAASLATAELFNPDTRSFAATGNMTCARSRHTATLLNNNQVLVIGGLDAGGNSLATGELFNPARGNFSPVRSMNTPRESHTATLLPNGTVFIAGGGNGGVVLATAELFDPTREIFIPAQNMDTARRFHTATLLKNGKVLLVGGRDAHDKVLATAELFDPVSGSFAAAGSMSIPRESHAATLLSDGKVLITGGNNGAEILATSELFDPVSGTFSPTGGMHAARELHTATLRNDGTVLVAGGAGIASTVEGSPRAATLPESIAMAELFNPVTGTFTPTNDMDNARSRHSAILLPDGEVLVTGGINPDISALADSLMSGETFK